MTVTLSFHDLPLVSQLFIGLLYLVSMWTPDNTIIAKPCLLDNCTHPFLALYGVSHVQEICRCFYGSDSKLLYVKLINAKKITKNHRCVLYFQFYSWDVPWAQTLAQQRFGRGKGQAGGGCSLGATAVGFWRKWGFTWEDGPTCNSFFFFLPTSCFLNFNMKLWDVDV